MRSCFGDQMRKRSLSPAEIIILFNIAHGRELWESPDAPIVGQTVERFMKEGLIYAGSESGAPVFHIQQRGRAFIEMVCCTPLPEMAWVDNRTHEVVAYHQPFGGAT
jgi:hypothetical protein